MASNFGAALAGQFLVSRPPGGVAGEGADLFPTASDYHLVCLQHDGAASLAVDGAAVYEGGLSVEAAAGEFFLWARETGDEREKRPAFHSQTRSRSPFLLSPPLSLSPAPGFKQYCAPVMLTPGWHDVAIKYGNSPRAVGGASSSVLRLFVIDAAQVRGGEGKAARACSWLGQSPPRGLEGEEQSGVPTHRLPSLHRPHTQPTRSIRSTLTASPPMRSCGRARAGAAPPRPRPRRRRPPTTRPAWPRSTAAASGRRVPARTAARRRRP